MEQINLKITDKAYKTIKRLVYCNGLAGNESELTIVWSKIIDSIEKEKGIHLIQLKEEKETE